jgi:hypothetical protein
MSTLEQAKAITKLTPKKARIEGMKLIALSAINKDVSMKDVEESLGSSYYNHLLNELRQQLNNL